MRTVLQLQDLYLGDLDAKHELLDNTTEEKERFVTAFLVPENVNIENFISGRLFYITGMKGTGKTALMRYIGILVEKQRKAHTSFILFKSHFTEDDRRDLVHAARASLVEVDKKEIPEEQDYEAVWRWFLHRHIVQQVLTNNIDVFQKDKNWEKYAACVMAPKMGDEQSGIRRFFPKIRRGSVEVSASVTDVHGKLGLDFEWEDNNKTRVHFNSIVRQADTLFETLEPGSTPMYIFVDELEISYVNRKAYERDVRLIRDLVLAVQSMNLLFRKRRVDIKIVCGVRSEVVSAIESSGKEINKALGDFGINIMWNQSGGDITEHPILRMLVRRIATSEEYYGIKGKDMKEVWKRWFPEEVQDTPTPKYLLHHTWYRPRDIIRLLRLAQGQFPTRERFDHQVFDAVRKQYSTDSWVEVTEELRATYGEKEVEVIRRLLYGFKPYFTFREMNARVNKLGEMYEDVKPIVDRLKLSNILSHLYRIGILGNVRDRRQRWVYRGDNEILLEQQITVHRALWNYLNLN